MDHMNGGGFMWLLWLLITGGIILLMIALSKNVRNNQLSAREILDQRYAKGEIDEAEYQAKKKLLENN